MYVCPKCKGELRELRCDLCQVTYPFTDGIPCFMTGNLEPTNQAIREIYDEIYLHHEDVWIDQGRSDEFQAYFAQLAGSFSTDRVLELGCGEGFVLAALTATHKYGIDPSVHALVRARARSNADCSVARAEELPFPSASFDLVVAVGVMEHFENPDQASAEVRRVLSPTGHYIVLIHTDMTLGDRLRLKTREFLYPRPRPLAMVKWLRKKFWHPIVQPLRKSYSIASARECLERSGLAVKQIISLETRPDTPLAGRHVVILVAQS